MQHYFDVAAQMRNLLAWGIAANAILNLVTLVLCVMSHIRLTRINGHIQHQGDELDSLDKRIGKIENRMFPGV